MQAWMKAVTSRQKLPGMKQEETGRQAGMRVEAGRQAGMQKQSRGR
jgi:hypothetical protein